MGYRPGFSIFDSQDSQTLVRDLLPRGSNAEAVDRCAWQISHLKGQCLDPQGAAELAGSPGESALAEIYQEYQAKLQHFNAVDFDDLILQPVLLFQRDPDVRLAWQERLRYLLVDEYQDTNASQFLMLQLLLGERGALTAVGDDDQSIYGWRGAKPENLDLLGDQFPDLKVIKLEQNYRSCRNILKAANQLISNNPHAHEKQLWSELGDGETIRVLPCDDATGEAESVVNSLIHRRFIHRNDYGQFAILYRSNHQARPFEQTLRSHRIAYVLSGGQSFFERSEIKDVLAYLRLIANPNDDSAFLRVINTPRRGIGAGSVEAVAEFATRHQISLLSGIKTDAGLAGLGRRGAIQARAFADWISTLGGLDPLSIVHRVIEDSDYFKYLKQQSKDGIQAERRIKAVEDLIDWMRRLVQESEQTLTLTDLIQQLALASGDDDEQPEEGAVRLMTLHAAKGLEFPHVYMVGAEEGILPHRNSVEDKTVAEERRLMYVGITRAQRSLTLSYAKSRRRYGETLRCEPSRFLTELPEELLHWRGRDSERDEAETKQTAKAHLANLRAMLDD
jgi:ATP-dependent DNA helicase Rep